MIRHRGNMTTKPLSEINGYQAAGALDGSFISILNDNSSPAALQRSRIISKMESIDHILNPTTSSNDNASLQSAALDLKCLALYLGEFQAQFTRRGLKADARCAPGHVIEQRIRIESQWLSTGMGLHILCRNILRNYKNEEWLSQNVQCIYFSLMILKNLCIGQSEVNINKLLDDTKEELLPIVLDIMNGAVSWIEMMICCELLRFLMMYDEDMKRWTDLVDSHVLNVIQLLIKSCCNCLKLHYFTESMKPYQADIVKMYEPINENVTTREEADHGPTYVRSSYSNQNDVTKSLHSLAVNCRINTLTLMTLLTTKYENAHDFVTKLLIPIPVQYWKRLLQISIMTMRQGLLLKGGQIGCRSSECVDAMTNCDICQ